MDQDNHKTRDRQSFFSHISASHEICWHHTGAIRFLSTLIHQYFQRHARTTQQCTTRLLRTTKGQQVPSHTSQHLPENSWTHQGDANVMASLHRHLCDAPIYGWARIFITVALLASTTISTGPTVLPWLGHHRGEDRTA
jgi:hypothetical protein